MVHISDIKYASQKLRSPQKYTCTGKVDVVPSTKLLFRLDWSESLQQGNKLYVQHGQMTYIETMT